MAVDVVTKANDDYQTLLAAKEAAANRAKVASKTGEDGNSYTEAIDANSLSKQDFLKLMLEEMKMQDPTKPMDSTKMMDNQLKMSSIDTNQEMAEAMKALTKTYAASSLSSAVGLMGKIVEDGSINEETEMIKQYRIKTVESKDGKFYVNANVASEFKHNVGIYGEEDENGNRPYTALNYDTEGNIKDKDGKATELNVKITKNGSFEVNNQNKIILYDNNGAEITDQDTLSDYGISAPYLVYSEDTVSILVNDITKVKAY